GEPPQVQSRSWRARSEVRLQARINRTVQDGIAQTIDSDKKRREKDEQVPINQLQDLVSVPSRQYHYEHRACQGRPRQIQSRDEADKDEHEHYTNNGKQAAIERGNGVHFSFDHRFLQNLSKPRSQDYEVDRESDDRRR